MKTQIHSHKDLVVWKKPLELVKEIYKLTAYFPKEELFGLTSQMRRSAVSIPSNIAEGRARGTRKDFAQFVRIAFGSGVELETQILLAKSLSYGPGTGYNNVEQSLTEILKMLNTMIGKLEARS